MHQDQRAFWGCVDRRLNRVEGAGRATSHGEDAVWAGGRGQVSAGSDGGCRNCEVAAKVAWAEASATANDVRAAQVRVSSLGEPEWEDRGSCERADGME